jgi:hypothetical protein
MRNSKTLITGVSYATFSQFMGQGVTERSHRTYVSRLDMMLYGVSIFSRDNVEGGPKRKPPLMILFSHERTTVRLL